MSRFYAKVLVPLTGDGWFQIEADLPDFDAVQADEMAVVRAALRQAFEFALGVDEAVAFEQHDLEDAAPVQPSRLEEAAGINGGPVPRRAPEPKPDPGHVENGRAAPPFPVEMIKCPECDREFVPSGLKVHQARAHPPERRCAEEGCGTILSRYNKGNRCGQHEGLRTA